MVLDLPPLRDFEHVIAVVLGPQRARVRQGRIEPETVEVIGHVVMVPDCFCRSALRRACFFHLSLPGPCLLGLRGRARLRAWLPAPSLPNRPPPEKMSCLTPLILPSTSPMQRRLHRLRGLRIRLDS